MIPSDAEIQVLWEKYHVPEIKRTHLLCVARVSDFLSEKLAEKGIPVDTSLVHAGALLHDIDKSVEKLPGERHPDAAVRILQDEGMDDIAKLVKTHPLHMILDSLKGPKTIEEKVLFLSDKMAKYESITVDKRFELWKQEVLPEEQEEILQKSYPLVKALEKEIFSIINIDSHEVAKIVK